MRHAVRSASAVDRLDLSTAAALFLVSLAVYLRTLCPTIYWGDCGELASAAYTLGITHPTGYPVWCLLAKAWSLLLPWGSVIWRMNTLSAVCGALAVVCLYGCGRALALPRGLAFAAAGCFAFSHTFWQQCLFAETYSLTACYTCLILWMVARWRARGNRPGDLRLLAFVCGLAMTNGQINTLFLPGVLAYVLWSAPPLRQWRDAGVRRQWLGTLAVGALPLLFYVYLPLRAWAHPRVNWGDPETPYAFYYHVTARAYTGRMFNAPLMTVLLRARNWATGLRGEYAWPLVGLALWGLVSFWRQRTTRPTALLLSWVIAADVFYTVNYGIYNAYIYFIPSYVALAVLAAVGLHDLWPRLLALVQPEKRANLQALGAVCLLIVVGFQAAGHWSENDLSHNWTCYDFGRNLLSSVPRGGVLVDNGTDDSKVPITFLQQVEGARPDVAYVSRGMLQSLYDFRYDHWANRWVWTQLEDVYPPARVLYPNDRITLLQVWQEDPLKRVIDEALASGRPVVVHRPVCVSRLLEVGKRQVHIADYLASRYDSATIGLMTRLYSRGHRPAPTQLMAETQGVWRGYSLRGVYEGLYVNDDFLTPMALDYAEAGLARARLAEAQGDYADAGQAYGDVLKLFASQEAADGVARCERAMTSRGRLALVKTPHAALSD